MTLVLLKLPLPILGVLVVGLPVLLTTLRLLLVRSRAPHPRLQPHHDVAGYIYSGLSVLYAVLLAFVVIIVWEQFNASRTRVHKEADAVGDLFRETYSGFHSCVRLGNGQALATPGRPRTIRPSDRKLL